LLAPVVQGGLDHALQVVDVVEEHPGELGDPGVQVTRHGDVDEDHRPPGPGGDHGREVVPAEHDVGRVGGGDDDVGGRQLVVDAVEAHAPSAHAGAELARRCHGPVGHHQVPAAR